MATSTIERVKLLDAPFRSDDAEAFPAGVQAAGRRGDAPVTMALRTPVRAGRIELSMRMRAAWRRLRARVRTLPPRSTSPAPDGEAA